MPCMGLGLARLCLWLATRNEERACGDATARPAAVLTRGPAGGADQAAAGTYDGRLRAQAVDSSTPSCADGRRTRGARLASAQGSDTPLAGNGSVNTCGPPRRPRTAAPAPMLAADACDLRCGNDRCGKARRVEPQDRKRGHDGRLIPIPARRRPARYDASAPPRDAPRILTGPPAPPAGGRPSPHPPGSQCP